jgi:Ser/Thr protein kinase RdoA (MazF antagonist)
MDDTTGVFDKLTPDLVLNSVEKATGRKLTGLTSPLPSYINRVYELLDVDGTRIVVKFYRPGRWTQEMINQEHEFVLDCEEDEIPVVAPVLLKNNRVTDLADSIIFSVFPKRSGREMEINSDDDWLRMGRLLGRIHNAGMKRKAPGRVVLHPLKSTAEELAWLIDGNFISLSHKQSFKDIVSRIIEISAPLFDKTDYIRVHGDAHLKNFLHRPGEGIMVIDFDDMATAPPVQDLWLLLPDHPDKCQNKLNILLEGYEQFREFDDFSLKLIEPLRAMRIIYFIAWCSRQANDYKFKTTFPNWGSELFWQTEVKDLSQQLDLIKKAVNL